MKPQLKEIAKTHYDLEIDQGPFGINSRPALIGMKFAEQQDKGHLYHDRVFRAYFQDGLDIGVIQTLKEIATEIGLNANAFETSLTDTDLNLAVTQDVETAHEYGITGVPAMLFVNKYLLSGAQPYEELVRIVDQLKQRENMN